MIAQIVIDIETGRQKVTRTNIDYRHLGLFKKEIFNSLGDFTTIEYYKNYDGTTYSDLEVKETLTYSRDVTTGLLTERDIDIEWYDKGSVIETKTTKKHYTAAKGYNGNKKARQNLINDASMYLMSQVGKSDGTAFFKLVRAEVEDYISTSDMELVNFINNSTESYMTQSIKDTLSAILNVVY